MMGARWAKWAKKEAPAALGKLLLSKLGLKLGLGLSQPAGAAQAATTGSTSDAASDDEVEPLKMADEDEETPVPVDIIADQLAPNEEDTGTAPLTANAATSVSLVVWCQTYRGGTVSG
eukprot:COSAG05_NODE_2074_length_3609_cov_4.982336_1_plen_118_part_00